MLFLYFNIKCVGFTIDFIIFKVFFKFFAHTLDNNEKKG